MGLFSFFFLLDVFWKILSELFFTSFFFCLLRDQHLMCLGQSASHPLLKKLVQSITSHVVLSNIAIVYCPRSSVEYSWNQLCSLCGLVSTVWVKTLLCSEFCNLAFPAQSVKKGASLPIIHPWTLKTGTKDLNLSQDGLKLHISAAKPFFFKCAIACVFYL